MKNNLIRLLRMRCLIIQLRWIDLLISIESLKESAKKEFILSLFGLIRLSPNTLIERFSRLILTGLRNRRAESNADKYDLKIDAIAEKFKKIEALRNPRVEGRK